jgi:hypothetical protein
VALVGSAMAAGLLIWAVLDSVEPTGTTRTFIVHHERPAKPHFLAAGLAEGWSGGSLHLGEGGRR